MYFYRIEAQTSKSQKHYSDVTWSSWYLKTPATELFVEQLVQGNIKRNIKDHWTFVRGILQWLVDSPHKGPVTQTAFPCHDILDTLYYAVQYKLWGACSPYFEENWSGYDKIQL